MLIVWAVNERVYSVLCSNVFISRSQRAGAKMEGSRMEYKFECILERCAFGSKNCVHHFEDGDYLCAFAAKKA